MCYMCVYNGQCVSMCRVFCLLIRDNGKFDNIENLKERKKKNTSNFFIKTYTVLMWKLRIRAI